MKAYQITKQSYEAILLPLFLEFKKFLRKNGKYYACSSIRGGGLIYSTLNEFIESEVVRNQKIIDEKTKNGTINGYDLDWYGKETTTEQTIAKWQRANGSMDEPPNEVIEEYSKYKELFYSYLIDPTKVYPNDLKNNNREIKRAIDKNLYIMDILNGELSLDEVISILESNNIRIPKNILSIRERNPNYLLTRISETSKNLYNAIIGELEDYMLMMANKRKDYITKIIGDFLDSGKDEVSFSTINNKFDNEVFFLLLLLTSKGKRVINFDTKIEKEANDYAKLLVMKFVVTFCDKISIMAKDIDPKIEFDVIYHSTDLITSGVVTIGSKKLYFNSSIILAGGYNIQSLHTRYLVKFFDNKQLSQKELDKI